MEQFTIVPAVVVNKYRSFDEQLESTPNPTGLAFLLRRGVRHSDIDPILTRAAQILHVDSDIFQDAFWKACRELAPSDDLTNLDYYNVS
jgi:hypothetical protein